jgi:YegS/Rv2252/BmrU family lipid kinase
MQEAKGTAKAEKQSTNAHPSAVLLANEKAGSFSKDKDQLEATLDYLRQHGWNVSLQFSKSADDARRIARQAVAQKIEVVVAVGGDGTINSVIQELAGSETALGLIPSGTFNVWAHETGIPMDIAGARNILVNGQTCRVDLGRVYNRYFLLMAGIGFGGTVTYAVKKKSMKRLGILGYLLTGIRLGLGFESFRATLDIDGHVQKAHALQIVVGNTQLYGSLLRFTWNAKSDDGLLDVCIVHSPKKLERIMVMLDFLLQRNERHKWVTYSTCKSVEVHTQKPVNFQVDGEPVGHTPATFVVVPNALKVIVPQEMPEELFSKR